jgi:hypothetical protein
MTKRYYKFKETHRTVNGIKQKRCIKCKKWKTQNTNEFRQDRARKDGLRIYCKDCDTVYDQEYRANHKGNVREYLRFEERHRIVKGVREKLCGRCKQWKDERDFYRDRGAKDGLATWCRDCQISRARKRLGQGRRAVRRNLRYEERHRVVSGATEKLCTKCRKWKKESEYYKDRSNRDSLMGRCQKCSYTPAVKPRK